MEELVVLIVHWKPLRLYQMKQNNEMIMDIPMAYILNNTM